MKGQAVDSFIKAVKDGAQKGRENHRVLASVSIAQAILESGWGKSTLATQGNNLFGIKTSDEWQGETITLPTKEWVNGEYITVDADFRKYPSWTESMADHARFFSSTEWRKNNYRNFLGETDYKKACHALKLAGYATAPDYAEKLINLIERYKLMQYDETTERQVDSVGYEYITKYNARNFTSGRQGNSIKYIVIHHWGARGQKFDGIINWFCNNPSCNNSAHYVVEDGKVACVVDLKNTAWHAGNWTYNLQSIGIECRPEATDGDYETIGELVAKIWKHYGKLPLIRHRDVPQARTACPGVYNMERIKQIAEKYYNKSEVSPVNLANVPREEPSEWAKESWQKMKSIGIMDGTRPKDTLTRQEMAVIADRLIELIGK